MTTGPKAGDLIQAVCDWIEVIRAELNARDAFLARVALNALGTVSREVEQGPSGKAQAVKRLRELLGTDGDYDTLTAELCSRLRCGLMNAETPGLLATLKANTAHQLAIDQPGYISSS